MSSTETYLLALSFVLFAALVIVTALGRIDARDANRLAVDKQRLEHKVRHLQERNAQLRDELDTATAAVDPSLASEVTAFLAHVTPEDFR